jgi:hypothetical protein
MAVALPLILLLGTNPLWAEAQSDAPRSYVAQIMGLVTEQDEKIVSEAMAEWETIDRFEISRTAHRMKFTVAQPVSEGELTERLTGTGTAVLWLAEVVADGSLSGASYETHAFPVFVDTGDPAGDNARYDADKATWLAAHPDWVDKNTRPDGQTGTEAVSDK